MKPDEIRNNLNRYVRYTSAKLGIDGVYRLTGAIIRRNEKGCYYQAELQELNDKKAIIICSLKDITAE